MLLGVAALLTSRSTVCHVRMRSDVTDRAFSDAADRASSEAAADAYGESTAPYEASEISPVQIEQLISRGYVVIDGAFDAEEAAGLELCLQLLDDSDSLAAEPDGSGRDDSIRFVDEGSAMLSIEAAIRRLKGYGERLQAPFAATRAEGEADSAWSAPWSSAPSAVGGGAAGGAAVERLEPREPATASRLLTASPLAQLASYAPEGAYCVHSDNSRGPEGARRNLRALTAIAYATPPDWSDEDAGCLRLWLGTDEVDCNVSGPEALGEELR